MDKDKKKNKRPFPSEESVLIKMRRISQLSSAALAQAKKSNMRDDYVLNQAEGVVAKKIRLARALLGTPMGDVKRRTGLIHSLWGMGGVPALEYVAHKQKTSVAIVLMEGLKLPGPGTAAFERLLQYRHILPIAARRTMLVYRAKFLRGELGMSARRPEDVPVKSLRDRTAADLAALTGQSEQSIENMSADELDELTKDLGQKPAWKMDYAGSPKPLSIPRGVESKARMQNKKTFNEKMALEGRGAGGRQPTPAELHGMSADVRRENADKIAAEDRAYELEISRLTIETALGNPNAQAELEKFQMEHAAEFEKQSARAAKREETKAHARNRQDYEVSTHSHSWPTDVLIKATGRGEDQALNAKVLADRQDLWPMLAPLAAPKGKVNSRVIARFRAVQAEQFADFVDEVPNVPSSHAYAHGSEILKRQKILETIMDPEKRPAKPSLVRWATHTDPVIRSAIACCPHTPPTVLLTLSRDTDEMVREAALNAQRNREKDQTTEPEPEQDR